MPDPAPAKKRDTGLKMQHKKLSDFAAWYTEIITKAEMIDYYPDVSGCYILRPWAYRVWEQIQTWLDAEFKKSGVEPCYFPLFISQKSLMKEESHVEGFAAEVAWVTKSGSTDLATPIAIRPTSETAMYASYKNWISSHRDLPLRLNQWTNVVRWEFKNPTPFLRTREFLWQEGHTAFATKEEADREVLEILDLYARTFEELCAVPVIKGRKSDKEKFAGGDYTTTVEAYIPASGRAIQGATSHSLGQNFAKMFDIKFRTEAHDSQLVWQNSWGLTTRTIGVMIMVHGDDKGLVMPPRVAPLQVVGVHIYASKDSDSVKQKVVEEVELQIAKLQRSGIRAKADTRTDRNPGYKYAFWEQKGVPIRLEIGPKDLELGQVVLVRRDTGSKLPTPVHDLARTVSDLLESIQTAMLNRARKERDSNIAVVRTFDDFCVALSKGKLILAPWSCTTESEEWLKEKTKELFPPGGVVDDEVDADGNSKQLTGAAKTLCLPFNQPPMPKGTKCFTGLNDDVARAWCLFGRSY